MCARLWLEGGMALCRGYYRAALRVSRGLPGPSVTLFASARIAHTIMGSLGFEGGAEGSGAPRELGLGLA